jgi:hypothetical protein
MKYIIVLLLIMPIIGNASTKYFRNMSEKPIDVTLEFDGCPSIRTIVERGQEKPIPTGDCALVNIKAKIANTNGNISEFADHTTGNAGYQFEIGDIVTSTNVTIKKN